jgi:hypothetical protein
MTDEKPRRISIGFIGGQALSSRVKQSELVRLREALRDTPQIWHELKADDGTVVLDLAKVVFVQVDDEEHRVGFGT